MLDQKRRQLAEEVDQILLDKGWSLRAAAAATGVSFNVIDRMIKGASVETHSILRFARAIAPEGQMTETVSHYLDLADKQDIVELLQAVQHEAQVPSASGGLTANEQEVLRWFRRAGSADQVLAIQLLKRLAVTQSHG